MEAVATTALPRALAANVSSPRLRAGSSIYLKVNAPGSHKLKPFVSRPRHAALFEQRSFFKSREYSLLRPRRSTRAEYYQESVPVGTKVEGEEVEEKAEKLVEVENAVKELEEQRESMKEKLVEGEEVEEKAEKLVEVENAVKELEEQTESMKEKFNGAVDNLMDESLNLQAPTEKSFADSTERAIGVLRDTTEQLREQTEKARTILAATALETAEKGKENLTLIAETAQGPIKDVAETALNAHSAGVPKKGARIHDFCLGIPYGGFLVVWGLLWFIVTGSTSAIRFGVILGGLILFSSVRSLKVWKKGESSIPFIKAQAALTLIILARDVRKFLETKAFFPSLIMCLISAAMAGFYGYVYFSGGNPPKKAKATPSIQEA